MKQRVAIQTYTGSLTRNLIDGFQVMVEEYLKRKEANEVGEITLGEKVLGFFGDIIKGGLGYEKLSSFSQMLTRTLIQ